jgi:putative endonuclease
MRNRRLQRGQRFGYGDDSTVAAGGRAEAAAAFYLAALGYEIVERNFRRKHCEIDIVVRYETHIIFVEVKYRVTDDFGSGLEYITADKLHRMSRAAETWVIAKNWRGTYALGAVEVGGPQYEVLNFIDQIV